MTTQTLPTSAAKAGLLASGIALMERFCLLNGIKTPSIQEYRRDGWRFGVCAYYDQGIHICVDKCATIGMGGRAWSYPGHIVDRTPYGVIQHELGHHVDVLRAGPGERAGRYWSSYSRSLRERTQEPAITGYCQNHAEWFAEIFRLFVTNPDLLRHLRPRAYEYLIGDGFRPVFEDAWDTLLSGAPPRTVIAARARIAREGGGMATLPLVEWASGAGSGKVAG